MIIITSNNQRLGSAGEDNAFCFWVNENVTKVYYLSCSRWRIEIDGSLSLL